MHRVVCQCLEVALMPEGELCSIHMEVDLVCLHQQEILLHFPLALVPHNSLHQAPMVKSQVVLQGIMAHLLQQEAVVMDRLWERWLLLASLTEEKVGDIPEVLNLKIILRLRIGKDNLLMVTLTKPREILK